MTIHSAPALIDLQVVGFDFIADFEGLRVLRMTVTGEVMGGRA